MPGQPTELRVRDVAVRLHRAGNGPTVLFLHGAGGVPQWLPLFDMMAERYQVLVPEHPGFGGSRDPSWITSMADLAMFYLDLVEEAALDRVHLIGSSLGGWLAAEILVRDRSRFRSLVQLAPAGIRVKGVPCGMPPGYTSIGSMKNFIRSRGALGGGRLGADALIESGTALIGSPQTVLAGIERMRERTGFGILVALLQFGILSDELTRRNMDMFAAEVIPHLRG